MRAVITNTVAYTPAQAKIEATTEGVHFDGKSWVYPEGVARFLGIEAGRRFGKTIFGVDKLKRWAAECPAEKFWYIAKSYRHAKEIAWDEFLKQIPPQAIRRKNERDLTIDLINKSHIALKGCDQKDDDLRGSRLGGLVMDEAAFLKPHIYSKILRPMLLDLRSPALIMSSPKIGWFTKLCDDAKTKKGWAYFHFTVYDNPHLSREEIEEIRVSESEETWLSEYMAERIEGTGVVYPEFSETHIIHPSTYPELSTVLYGVGMDWGKNAESGFSWVAGMPNGHLIVSREHARAGWDTQKHSEIILQKSHGLDIRAYVLDKSAFREEGTSGDSISRQFSDQLKRTILRSDKDVKAGVDMVKRYFRNGWLKVSYECKETIKAIRAWEHGDHEPDLLAAMRYIIFHMVSRGLVPHPIGTNPIPFPNIFDQEKEKSVFLGLKGPKMNRDAHWSWDRSCGAFV